MKHEPQHFANLDGVLVVKAFARHINLSDLGVAHSAQNKFKLNRLARRGTDAVDRHI